MSGLVVAFPFYRNLSVTWFFNFIGMDTRPVVGMTGTDGTILHLAMQQLVEMAFANYPVWDRLVIWEHDVLPTRDALTRIAEYRVEHDIVGTMQFRHEAPHHVMAGMRVKPPFVTPLTAEVTRAMVEQPALYEVDAVTTGFTAIRREVFEKWDVSVPMWKPTPPLLGHDLHFCNEAKKQGFKVWLDSGIRCGHLTVLPIGYEDQQAHLAGKPPPGEPEMWC